MLILRQSFSKFVPPDWNLDDPYYHNDKKEQGRNILKHFCDTQKKFSWQNKKIRWQNRLSQSGSIFISIDTHLRNSWKLATK